MPRSAQATFARGSHERNSWKGNARPGCRSTCCGGFRAAARHLSFTRAAHELFVTQSAISLEIRKLEEQLGTPLFARANRSLRLTQAGERLYHAVDEALGLIEAATAELSVPVAR